MEKRVSDLTPAEAKQARIDWLRQNVHYTNEPGHIACLLARLDQLEQALRVVATKAKDALGQCTGGSGGSNGGPSE